MVRAEIMLCAALITAAGLAQQDGGKNLIRNGGFEQWTGSEPVAWETNNIPKALLAVSPSPKSQSGRTAVLIAVKEFFGTRLAGLIVQKGVPISGRSLRLTGAYLFHQAGHNVGFVTFDFHSDEGSTVGTCEQYLKESRAGFTSFVLDARVPASAVQVDIRCSILEGAPGDKLHEGSFLLFDDLRLVSDIAADSTSVGKS